MKALWTVQPRDMTQWLKRTTLHYAGPVSDALFQVSRLPNFVSRLDRSRGFSVRPALTTGILFITPTKPSTAMATSPLR